MSRRDRIIPEGQDLIVTSDKSDLVVGKDLFPAKTRSPAPGIGAHGVRHQPGPEEAVYTSEEAAILSPLFKRGGEAFAGWVAKNKSISVKVRMALREWEPLLVEFASRLILGHRRRQGSTSHRRR